jgi:hypothetical protein
MPCEKKDLCAIGSSHGHTVQCMPAQVPVCSPASVGFVLAVRRLSLFGHGSSSSQLVCLPLFLVEMLFSVMGDHLFEVHRVAGRHIVRGAVLEDPMSAREGARDSVSQEDLILGASHL